MDAKSAFGAAVIGLIGMVLAALIGVFGEDIRRMTREGLGLGPTPTFVPTSVPLPTDPPVQQATPIPNPTLVTGSGQCPVVNGTAGQQLSEGMCKYFFQEPATVTVPDGWYADAYLTNGEGAKYGIPAMTTITTNEMTLKLQAASSGSTSPQAPQAPSSSECPAMNGTAGQQLSAGMCKYFFQEPATVTVPDGWYADAFLTGPGVAKYGIPAGTTITTNEMTLKVLSR